MTTEFETDHQAEMAKMFEQRVEAILRLGIEQFGLPIGIFSAIGEETYEIRQVFHPENALTPGMAFDLDDTFCSHVISASKVSAFHDVRESELADHPAGEKFGFAAYLGAPIVVEGECIGTLAFGSPSPVAAFAKHDIDLVQLFADSIGQTVAHIHDRKALEQAKKDIERSANTDPLTGLYNRRYMETVLRTELERSNRYGNSVVAGMVYFDNLKNLNESFGYDAGDAALKLFAKVASEMMRETDVIARWSDKEFIILMPETGAAGALNYLQRLTDRVGAEDFQAGSEHPRLTLSVGLGIAEKGDTLDKLVSRTSIAMHQSKQS
ncbi:sensor domain-containing diguanylate cyclase [Thalassospira sp. HF15]|uniref:sensor domain-containing diguanylate cyclase n=1 Tax=Thalassospira sp. HF15 TaxID=2722755 RepID=UPI001430D55D|nr:sensor domain-containing diguanylate cyclase [Thalassospira sp. HF15]NIY75574.1 sensor domain-containing diguanylate cyclase [Thalassospira sp. HF15]